MSLYSPSIEKLIESFERLPSIGHKTAARLAFYILNCSEEEQVLKPAGEILFALHATQAEILPEGILIRRA